MLTHTQLWLRLRRVDRLLLMHFHCLLCKSTRIANRSKDGAFSLDVWTDARRLHQYLDLSHVKLHAKITTYKASYDIKLYIRVALFFKNTVLSTVHQQRNLGNPFNLNPLCNKEQSCQINNETPFRVHIRAATLRSWKLEVFRGELIHQSTKFQLFKLYVALCRACWPYYILKCGVSAKKKQGNFTSRVQRGDAFKSNFEART